MYISDLIETVESSKVVVGSYTLSYDRNRERFVIAQTLPGGEKDVFEDINEEVAVHKLLDLTGN
jgi:hypothetical protein